MGEAKRKALRREAERRERMTWEATLIERDQIVVRIAERVAVVLPLDGACYQTTMFLKYHLHSSYGIASEAVVGFVNDGTDAAFSYHAWLEVEGRVVDVTLCRPLDPINQKRGRTLVLDRQTLPGWQYSYHRKRSQEGMLIMRNLLQDEEVRNMLMVGEETHMSMLARARSLELIRAYLDSAPGGLTYDRLAKLVEG